MKLLLDTHYAFALAGAPGRLSSKEQRYLERHSAHFVLSLVSLWEARIKWNVYDARGHRKGPMDAETMFTILSRLGVETLDLAPAHIFATLRQSLPHSDPFDELLVAQAQVEGMRLLTRDTQLAGHPLAQTI